VATTPPPPPPPHHAKGLTRTKVPQSTQPRVRSTAFFHWA
jgi:hypothetical protein